MTDVNSVIRIPELFCDVLSHIGLRDAMRLGATCKEYHAKIHKFMDIIIARVLEAMCVPDYKVFEYILEQPTGSDQMKQFVQVQICQRNVMMLLCLEKHRVTRKFLRSVSMTGSVVEEFLVLLYELIAFVRVVEWPEAYGVLLIFLEKEVRENSVIKDVYSDTLQDLLVNDDLCGLTEDQIASLMKLC